MLVRESMTHISTTPDTPLLGALRLMRERKVDYLPVLDSHNELVGIVSEKDLLYASPSPATTLDIWEMPELLAKLRIEKVMTREIITVSEETPLENAVIIMVDHRIGGLPVMQGQALVGIITETDLFKAFLKLLGGRKPGVRVTVSAPNTKGTLAKIATAIFGAGGSIVGLGFSEITDPNGIQCETTFKV